MKALFCILSLVFSMTAFSNIRYEKSLFIKDYPQEVFYFADSLEEANHLIYINISRDLVLQNKILKIELKAGDRIMITETTKELMYLPDDIKGVFDNGKLRSEFTEISFSERNNKIHLYKLIGPNSIYKTKKRTYNGTGVAFDDEGNVIALAMKPNSEFKLKSGEKLGIYRIFFKNKGEDVDSIFPIGDYNEISASCSILGKAEKRTFGKAQLLLSDDEQLLQANDCTKEPVTIMTNLGEENACLFRSFDCKFKGGVPRNAIDTVKDLPITTKLNTSESASKVCALGDSGDLRDFISYVKFATTPVKVFDIDLNMPVTYPVGTTYYRQQVRCFYWGTIL